ncbi:MAG: CoA transferase [Hyphomicrobiaceae bacterium]
MAHGRRESHKAHAPDRTWAGTCRIFPSGEVRAKLSGTFASPSGADFPLDQSDTGARHGQRSRWHDRSRPWQDTRCGLGLHVSERPRGARTSRRRARRGADARRRLSHLGPRQGLDPPRSGVRLAPSRRGHGRSESRRRTAGPPHRRRRCPDRRLRPLQPVAGPAATRRARAPQPPPRSLLDHRLRQARPLSRRAACRRSGAGPHGRPGRHAGLSSAAGSRRAPPAERRRGASGLQRHRGKPPGARDDRARTQRRDVTDGGRAALSSQGRGERIKRHVFQTHPSGSAPFYSLYRCADGRFVQLGCVHAAFIAVAARLMGLDKLIEEPRFDKGRAGATPADDAELRAAVAHVIETKPFPQWAAELEAADVPFAEARQTQESLDDPQITHNGMLVTLEDPGVGPMEQMGVPVALSATPGRVQGPRPRAETDGDLGAPRAATAGAGGNEQAPPLDGVRILEITNLIAGPTAGRILADLGADVIKLEPPEGDMSRPIGRTYFYSVNFNKRSIAIDMRKPDAKRIVQAIAAKADALVANLRPKATERMGIGPAVNPRLIETHLTGYGATGPYSHRPGIDPLAQAMMGLSRAQGGKENPPVFPAQLAPTDYTTGAMGAFGTILALLERKRHGTVQRVDVNLLSGGIVLASEWFTRYRGRPERPLADKDQMGLTPSHRLFHVADGWVYVTADTPEHQAALWQVAGVDPSAYAADAGDAHPNETPFAHAVAKALAGRTCAALLDALAAHGVPAAPAMAGDSEIFLDDPHAEANAMVAVRTHPTAGQIRVAWNYVSLPGTRATAGRHTPLLGEHSQEVLREIGLAEAEVARLAADGTIVTER